MAISVTMPRLGESVTEGTVTRWLKKQGERVDADEPLLEVSTDKVDTEIPSPASGVLSIIRVSEDETVEVGAELAVIDESGAAAEAATTAESGAEPEQAPPPTAAVPAAAAPAVEAVPTPTPAAPAVESAPAPTTPRVESAPAPSGPTPAAPSADGQATDGQAPTAEAPTAEAPTDEHAAYATPLVRKLATEHHVALGEITGTGVGGRIRKQDVLDAARTTSRPAGTQPTTQRSTTQSTPTATRPAVVRGRTEQLSRLRKVIAERMVSSLQVGAQLTTVVEVDVTRIARLRDEAKAGFEQREGTKLSFLPFFAVAAVEGLRIHPMLNASIDLDAGTATYHEAVHLGIAVDTERGLLVPVIHDASDLNIAGIARKVADLAERTRSNRITPDELGGGTFTLTNTGSRGALFDTPIINQPQVAILGTGSVVKRPVVVADPDLGDVIAVRSMAYLALTYDHRLVDGADAARYLLTVKTRLEEGRFESDLGLDAT